MKIVHIVDYLMPTMGYQEFLLPKWHKKHGHDVHIITSDRYYPVPDYEQTWQKFLGERILPQGTEEVEGVVIHRLKCLVEAKYRPFLPGIGKKIRELSPEVIFCHGTASIAALQVAWVARKYNIPLVMDNHMTFGCQDKSVLGKIGYPALKFLSQKFLANNCYKFMGVANECCDFLIKAQGLDPKQVEDLPLGIDTDIFSENMAGRDSLRKKYDIPEDAFVVMQTGKLTADKSPHYLSAAMALLLHDNEKLRLVFLGSGGEQYLKQVKEPLEKAGVMDKVKFLPLMPVKELPGAYSAADLLVYPDASSLSCMEAAACRRTVIMSDLPASKWRESIGVGICYNTGNIEELKKLIHDLYSNPDKLGSVAEKSLQAVLDNFSYDAIARKSEEIMKQAIENKKAP